VMTLFKRRWDTPRPATLYRGLVPLHLDHPVALATDGPASAGTPATAFPGRPSATHVVFALDTGANAIVVGVTPPSPFLSGFVPAAAGGPHVRSNGHKDPIMGTVTVAGFLELEDAQYHNVVLPGALVVPTSRWNILPPSLLPGFESASIAAGGRISIRLAGRQSALLSVPYKGLQVIFLRLEGVVLNVDVPPALVASTPPGPLMIRLHERLSHAPASTIHRLVRAGVVQVPDKAARAAVLATASIDCRHCAMASNPVQRVNSVGHTPSPSDKGLFSADLFGPFIPSAGGCRYCSVTISHKSRWSFVGFHKAKSGYADWFAANYDSIALTANDEVLILRTDNGGEFVNATLARFCQDRGIVRQFTAADSSFQNGLAEVVIRILRGKAGASLSRSGLHIAFWAEAVAHANYVRNRLPPTAGGPSPYERATGSAPSLRFLHPFGCLAMVRVKQPKKSSLANRSRPSVYLGPALATKDAHRVIHLDTRSVAVTRNCVFFDGDFPLNSGSRPGARLQERGMDVPAPSPPPLSRVPADILSNNPFSPLSLPDDDDRSVAVNRPRRIISAPDDGYYPGAAEAQRRHDMLQPQANVATHGHGSLGYDVVEPNTLSSALSTDQRQQWISAVASELASHKKNGTWTVTKVPPGRSAIPARYVFKVKRGKGGEITRFKARLVAKGFRQRADLDYTETFAPTLRLTSFRALCAIACQYGFEVHAMDVSTAFLVPELQEEIYLRLPEQGLVDSVLPDFGTGGVKTVRLHKSLYGLKQSPRLWYQHLGATLGSLGFVQSSCDPCLWVKVVDGKLVAILAVFVDDVAIAAKASDVRPIKQALRRQYEMTDDGPISWFLGVRLVQDVAAGTFSLDQATSVRHILAEYRMDECKPVSTPSEGVLRHSANDLTPEDRLFMQDKDYRSLVGKLLYLLFTRPDIAFAVNQLTRHLNNTIDL
jgi:transposase InsO family protein